MNRHLSKPRPIKRHAHVSKPVNGTDWLTRLWALRILNHPQVQHQVRVGSVELDADLWIALGWDPPESDVDPFEDEDDDDDSDGVHSTGWMPPGNELKRALLDAERRRPDFPSPLADNLSKIQQVLGLSDLERELLGFFVLLDRTEWLSDAAGGFGYTLDDQRLGRVLSCILKWPVKVIMLALGSRGTLYRVGLVRLDDSDCGTLASRVDLMNGLAQALNQPADGADEIFGRLFRTAPPSSLTPADYVHVERDFDNVRQLLAHAARQGVSGVNILIYGPPGGGKTELARLVAREAGLELFEVSAKDADGDPYPAEKRLPVFQLCQAALARRGQAAVFFDEAEDAFPCHSLDALFEWEGTEERHKAWTNQLLESNPVPSLWVTNGIRQIDPAFLRRFAYTLKLDTPGESVRHRILKTRVEGLGVSDEWIRRIATHTECMPAHLDTAVRTARLVVEPGEEAPGARIEKVMERVLENLLEAVDEPCAITRKRPDPLPYRLDCLNPDTDLGALIAGLQKTPEARICLYGPPGTGKTAFGKHLAEILGKPLWVKRASDLLGSLVGESEANIAGMFREASRAGALLLVDEADTFLRDRQGAFQSWEVSQVNEFLVGLENYEGLFVASTNLVGGLDPAVFRRFDFKIRFDALTAQQRLNLFNTVLTGWNEPELTETDPCGQALGALVGLTPGDFRAAVRKIHLLGTPSASTLLSALKGELGFKPGARKRGIGFLAE